MLYDPNWQNKKPTARKLRGWRRILWEGADVIEKEGWIQHEGRNEKGYCIIGAMLTLTASARSFVIAECKLAEAVGVIFVEDWNDHKRRTKAQVISKMREAALS
jgi:hypothetical protein